jgi:hypothetical protein
MIRKLAIAAVVLFAWCGIARGQTAASPAAPPAGHWAGSIEAGAAVAVEVDIERQGEGWRGTMSVPAQNARGVPLTDVTLKDGTLSFVVKGGSQPPRFSGELSKDGKTITGTLATGGGSVPMSMTWKGEAQFEKPVKNPPVSTAVLGSWEGTLNANGTNVRLVLTLANGADGATGTMVSVDQGNAEIPISAISEQGAHLKLTVSMIGGAFEGDLKGDEIVGTWTQGPGTLPLTFKKKS